MKRVVALIFACTICSASIAAQTAPDIATYFKPTSQPGIYTGYGVSLAVLFDRDGQVCKVVWPAENYSKNAITAGREQMEGGAIKSILYLIARDDVRGKAVGTWGQSWTGGGFVGSTYDYENVTLKTYSGFGLQPYDGTTLRRGEFTFSLSYDNGKDQDLVDPLEAVRRAEKIESANVAVVTWKNRKCVE
jgi:hypothetical protein